MGPVGTGVDVGPAPCPESSRTMGLVPPTVSLGSLPAEFAATVCPDLRTNLEGLTGKESRPASVGLVGGHGVPMGPEGAPEGTGCAKRRCMAS